MRLAALSLTLLCSVVRAGLGQGLAPDDPDILRQAPVAASFRGVLPNPFRGSTSFELALAQPARVELVVYDVLGASLQVHQAVVPFLTVKRGQVFMPDWGPRPWGWEPDRVLPAVAGVGGCC